MIKKIGFENFRRFANFPTIEMGDVTLLVGGNNSGKSTLVKAILLCVDNLRMMNVSDNTNNLFSNYPQFRFDANEYHDAKVKSFVRALHNKVKPYSTHIYSDNNGKLINEKDYNDIDAKSFDYTITFYLAIDDFQFTITIGGDRFNENSIAFVKYIFIKDKKNSANYAIDYDGTMMYSISNEVDKLNNDLKSQMELLSSITTAQRSLAEASEKEDLKEITNITANIEKLVTSYNAKYGANINATISEEEINNLKSHIFDNWTNRAASFSAILPLNIYLNDVHEAVIENVISNLINFASSPSEIAPVKKDYMTQGKFEDKMQEYEYRESSRQLLRQEMSKMQGTRKNLHKLLSELNVQYIPAHAANQNTLYSTNDRNDYIAQVVHEFYREKFNPGDSEYIFVKKWMKTFEIGEDFKIIPLVSGEAYKVDIEDEDGSTVPLADKGMGSIQMMILLLKLATINHQTRHNVYPTTILIEEPEQNLHPKMQSLLADLFAELAKDNKMQFIIETHSEYLIRKTQVLVANENYMNEDELKENNPFKVYYLPTGDEAPYEMNYSISGRFINKFGEGFFDEAGKSNLITLRKEKGLK